MNQFFHTVISEYKLISQAVLRLKYGILRNVNAEGFTVLDRSVHCLIYEKVITLTQRVSRLLLASNTVWRFFKTKEKEKQKPMQKDKREMRKLLETDQDFPQFLKQLRKEENILLDELSEGLMTVSQLARIEKGQRPISKNMRDRMLGRLGIANDLYENLLNIEDYAVWEQERNILHAVEEREIQKAQELILAYEKQEIEPNRDKIKQQFCLVMRADILKQQNADWQEIGDCYEKAVKLTVPDIENLHIEGKLLCIQEVNMILEYEFYHKREDFAEKCMELIAYVEKSLYDDLSKVKIYPKIVYYYLREICERQNVQSSINLAASMKIYDQAIEMLRNTGRAYFLLELLETKIKITEYTGNVRESGAIGLSLRESIELAGLLKRLYGEYEVPAYMQDCTYLYRQRWMFYVGDVLRIRRQMYGLTQKALCEGICSVRTLRRAEKREMNMHNGVLGALLGRLGLSKEFQKARLVTNDKEVLKLREDIALCRNNREIEKARELLEQIKRKVSIEIPENHQYFIETEASLDWMEKKITKEEYADRERTAIRCTLDAKDLYRADEIYLTEMELLCIRNRMQGLDDSGRRNEISFLLHFFQFYERNNILSDCISMYEFVTAYIASELGNIGEYEAAINLDKKVLRQELRNRRFWETSSVIYDIIWNKKELNIEYPAENKKMTESLEWCVILSHFCKKTFYEKFYCNKLCQDTLSFEGGRSLHGETVSSPE